MFMISPQRWTATAFVFVLVAASSTVTAPAGAADIGCGAVVTRSTTLHKDIGPCPGEGLIVAGDGITLDLNGHRVLGDPHVRRSPDKAGVLLRQVSGVTLTDGIVEAFDAGVVIMGGGSNRVLKVTAQNNVNYRVITGRDSQVADIVSEDGPFCDLGDGIAVFNSSDNVFQYNNIVGNGPFSGLAMVGNADRNVVSKNNFRDNDVLNDTPQGWGTICGGDPDGPVPNPGPPEPPPDPPLECCATMGRHVQDIGVRVEGPGAERNLIEAKEAFGNSPRVSGARGLSSWCAGVRRRR